MKKKIIFGSTLLALVLCIFGCNFQFPETISVKSNAKYEFAIANKSFPLGDLFSIDKLKDSFSGQSTDSASNDEESVEADIKIYDYNPERGKTDADIQEFLVSMKLQEIPLDFNNYLKDVDFGSKLESMNISKEIAVPSVDIDEVKVVDVEVNEKINALVSFRGTTQADAPLSVSFEGTGNGFNSVTYKTGFMVVSNTPNLDNVDFGEYGHTGFTLPTFIPDGKLSGTVKLLYNGTVISEDDFDENGLALLPLDNVTVYKEGMSLQFSGDPDKTFYALVSQDSQVFKADDISLSEPIESSLKSTFNIGNDSALKSCEIKKGKLAVDFAFPTEWTGIEINSYQIDLTGGLNVTLAYNKLLDSSTRKEFDFAEVGLTQQQKTFVNTDINANTRVNIKMTHASLQFIDSDNPEKKINPSVKVEAKIEEVASALVVLQKASSGDSASQNSEESSFNTRVEDSQKLSDDILNAIQSIKWNPSGLSISYLNTLPSENELKLKFNSNFFGISDLEKTFEFTEITEGSENRKTLDFLSAGVGAEGFETKLGNNAADNEFNSIDYSAELILPDYNVDSDGNKTITVRDVRPGETYLIDLVITPKPDWYAVYIKSNLTNQEGKISTGLNLSSLMKGMEDKLGDNLANKIKIHSLPLYLFCQIPAIGNVFNEPKFVGTINAYIGDENNEQVPGTKNIYLLGKEKEDGELEDGKLVNADIPEFLFDENNKNMVISSLISNLNGVEPVDMKDLIDTSADGSLCVDYNVRFETGKNGNVEILAEKLKDIPTTSIKLSGLVKLSLSFDVNEPINMDVLKLVKGDSEENSENEDDSGDLLGRSEPTNTEDFQKYLDIIESASIDYKTSALPFIFSDNDDTKEEVITIKVDLDGEGTKFVPQVLKFSGDSFAANPSDLLNTFPLKPSVEFEIPVGTLSIPRKMDFAANINLTVQTNGKVTVWEKNAKNGGEE